MTANESLIEIIIPNWNGEALLADCLRSLKKQTAAHFSVTVVDNGSEDNSLEMVKNVFPEAKTLTFDHNTGFSVAVNRGIEASSAPWLLLLNNDMEVAEDCLEKLLGAIQKYDEYDFFALKMMNFHNRAYIDGAGDAVLRGGAGYRLGTMEQDTPYYTEDRDCFGACAGAALYKREFFHQIGIFDPDFFAYLEDVDLNMRANRAGMRCRFIASAIVYHIGSASSGSKINAFTVRLSTRNNIYVLLKNYPLSLFLRFLPAIIVYQFMWMVFCCKKGLIFPYIVGLFQAVRSSLPQLKKKRYLLKKEKCIAQKAFASMVNTSEREAVTSIMNRRAASGKSNIFFHCYTRLFL
jgi:GT2 family glycosyltransferase